MFKILVRSGNIVKEQKMTSAARYQKIEEKWQDMRLGSRQKPLPASVFKS